MRTIISLLTFCVLIPFTAHANKLVDVEYIREMKSTNLRGLDLDDIWHLQNASATPGYIRDMKKIGLRNFDADDAIKLARAKVPVKYARTAKGIATRSSLDAGDVIKIYAADIPYDYLKAVKSAHTTRLHNFDENDLIKLYQAGVSSVYIHNISNLGLRNFDANDIIKLSNANITPQYAHSMKKVGLRNMDENDLIKLSKASITPEFAREAKSIGMHDADDVIKLAQKFGNGKIPKTAAKSKPSSQKTHLSSLTNHATILGLMLLIGYGAYRFYQNRDDIYPSSTDDLDTRITHFERRVGDLQDILISIDDRLSRRLKRT